MKKKIVVTEDQLRKLKDTLSENKHNNSMAKQQLFTIATLAKKMWEEMDENDVLEDWQESKIAQVEQSIIAVVKSYMYDEFVDGEKGIEGLTLDDIIIGQ
jgi:ferritin-like metal-binding protein YciE